MRKSMDLHRSTCLRVRSKPALLLSFSCGYFDVSGASMCEGVFVRARVQASVEVKYTPGDVIAVANGHPNSRVFLVKSGEVTLVSADVHISGRWHTRGPRAHGSRFTRA